MTKVSLISRAALVVLCATCALPSLGQTQKPQTQPTCTKSEALQADSDTDKLQTWSDVYRSFRKFAQCDDASISESYSDKIMLLFVYHWNDLPELNRLATSNVSFRKFALRHVDELASQEELRAVQQNARSLCPSSSKRLCSDIDKRIRETLTLDRKGYRRLE